MAAEASEPAAEGRRLVYQRGDGEALLASVRGNAPPRIHPVNVGILGDRLASALQTSGRPATPPGDRLDQSPI
ncbi:MAG: hypothetical protein ABI578_07985 [Chloroflexota bacterium]